MTGAHSTIAKTAQVLAWEEREAPDISDAPRPTPLKILSPDSLRRVLDNMQAMLTGDGTFLQNWQSCNELKGGPSTQLQEYLLASRFEDPDPIMESKQKWIRH